MIHRVTVLFAALWVITLSLTAGDPTAGVDTTEDLEAMPADVVEALSEENLSRETNGTPQTEAVER